MGLMPAMHAQEIKLVPETCASRLVQETCTCVGQSCTSFVSYKFPAHNIIEHSSIPVQKLSGTWHEPCNAIGRPVVVQETVMNLR